MYISLEIRRYSVNAETAKKFINIGIIPMPTEETTSYKGYTQRFTTVSV